MSKAKVKVKVKSVSRGSGTLLASVPVTVVRNDNPSGERMFQTRAKALIDIRTTRNGKPRIRHR